MRVRELRNSLFFAGAALFCNVAISAEQCLAEPGTYGAVVVTGCDDDPVNGVSNPLSRHVDPATMDLTNYPYDGLALGSTLGGGGGLGSATCTYNFSHPVSVDSLKINLDAIQAEDVFSIELDGVPYEFTANDLSATPLPDSTASILGGAFVAAPLATVGGKITTSTSDPIGLSSGTATVASTQERFSSLKLTMTYGQLGGGVSQVCVDDAPAATSTANNKPKAVPTLEAWSIIGLSAFLALFGLSRQNKKRPQRAA